MKRFISIIAAAVFALAATTVFAGKCCEEAKLAGKVCEKCTPAADAAAAKAACADCKDGEKCAKCKNAEAVKAGIKEGSCCGKAQAAGKDCTHPCCTKSAAEGKACPKCNG